MHKLPDSIKQLNAFKVLYVRDYGSLEDLGALTTLLGLRIWRCKDHHKSSKVVSYSNQDIHSSSSEFFWSGFPYIMNNFRYLWKKSLVLEENDCVSLRFHQDTQSGELHLLCAHKLPCEEEDEESRR